MSEERKDNSFDIERNLEKAFPEMPESFEARMKSALDKLPEAPPLHDKASAPGRKKIISIIATAAAGLLIVFALSSIFMSNGGFYTPSAPAPAADAAYEEAALEAEEPVAAEEAAPAAEEPVAAEEAAPADWEASYDYSADADSNAELACELLFIYYQGKSGAVIPDVSDMILRNENTEDFYKLFDALAESPPESASVEKGGYTIISCDSHGDYADMHIIITTLIDGNEVNDELLLTFKLDGARSVIEKYNTAGSETP